jgi:hypothetical protein
MRRDAETLWALYEASPNCPAWGKVLREGESDQTDRAWYRRWPGSGKPPAYFDDLSCHPRIFEPGPAGPSSAAGAFQITATTWDSLGYLGLPDFSEKSQCIAMLALTERRGALEDVLAGRLDAAMRKCRLEWSSLPYGTDGQPTLGLARAEGVWDQAGGTAATLVTSTPQAEPVKESKVPIFAALLPSLIAMVPELFKIFGAGATTEVSKRNVAAAEAVTGALLNSTGAVNLQAAVEAMQADPVVATAAREAVIAEPAIAMLIEVGGGVEAARKASADPNAMPFWKQGAFVMGCILTPLIYMVVYAVMWGEGSSEQLKTVVVTAILSGLLGALTGFFFGAMYSAGKRAADTGVR